jgi:hypothetical protein
MYNSQAGQDKFVLNCLKYKRNGFFLEIGSGDPIIHNNTCILEKHYNWKGLMIESNSQYLGPYKKERQNSFHIMEDAIKIDYRKHLNAVNAPYNIDYLQIDLEVGDNSTLLTLQKLDNEVFDKYKFATITFEHDIYSTMLYKTNKPFNPETRRLSREIFNNRGYIMVFDDVNNGGENPYEDWYVHPDLVDMNHINKLKDMNKNNYKDTPSMGLSYKMKSINYQDIIY